MMQTDQLMENDTTHASFTLERTYRAAPERVFAAFSDPGQKRRWFAEGEDWNVESYELDFREGGWERSRFRFRGGNLITNDTVFHDIVPNRRIVISYDMTMSGERFSVSLQTVELLPEGSGTLLRFTEHVAFFDGADGLDRRREGTRGLLDALARHLGEGEASVRNPAH